MESLNKSARVTVTHSRVEIERGKRGATYDRDYADVLLAWLEDDRFTVFTYERQTCTYGRIYWQDVTEYCYQCEPSVEYAQPVNEWSYADHIERCG